jgi:unsaturated rhamnogalacturonyl hydrolase
MGSLCFFSILNQTNMTHTLRISVLSLASIGCLVLAGVSSMAEEENAALSKESSQTFSSAFNKADVLKVGNSVAEWQMENFSKMKSSSFPESWLNGALYLGMMDWADLTGDKKIDDWLMKKFNSFKWRPAPRMYHADDVAVCQTYLDMYRKHKKETMLWPTQARTEWVVNHPSQGSMDLNYGKPSSLERWSWCDALFMAPPVYARMYALTGDRKFMDFADKEYKATYDKLFDKEENLFFRDSTYFGKKEANGKKIFWGRGNGWVVGGLAEMLKELPQDDKTYRPFYEKLFVTLCSRLLKLQCKDGFWRASLLDPESYPSPETSATGFITYGMAYGVEQGILPRNQFLPAVEKGWKALVNSVGPDGKLYWVQPVGADPKHVDKQNTEVYGVGAFLLTAAEVYKLSK